MDFRNVHLHGFASGPKSKKGLFLKERFAARGLHLELPDLNRPSFADLTYSSALAVLDELSAGQKDRDLLWRVSGSSMGGYLAARWAELNPDRVDRLVLLCPGFDFLKRWEAILGEGILDRWERDGFLEFPDGAGREVPVHFGLIEDCRRHPPSPEVPCPTLILHGVRDEIVPVEHSRRYAAEHPDRVRLVELDDDHYLMNSLDTLAEETLSFYENQGR